MRGYFLGGAHTHNPVGRVFLVIRKPENPVGLRFTSIKKEGESGRSLSRKSRKHRGRIRCVFLYTRYPCMVVLGRRAA